MLPPPLLRGTPEPSRGKRDDCVGCNYYTLQGNTGEHAGNTRGTPEDDLDQLSDLQGEHREHRIAYPPRIANKKITRNRGGLRWQLYIEPV
jgi:hypothetical protein